MWRFMFWGTIYFVCEMAAVIKYLQIGNKSKLPTNNSPIAATVRNFIGTLLYEVRQSCQFTVFDWEMRYWQLRRNSYQWAHCVSFPLYLVFRHSLPLLAFSVIDIYSGWCAPRCYIPISKPTTPHLQFCHFCSAAALSYLLQHLPRLNYDFWKLIRGILSECRSCMIMWLTYTTAHFWPLPPPRSLLCQASGRYWLTLYLKLCPHLPLRCAIFFSPSSPLPLVISFLVFAYTFQITGWQDALLRVFIVDNINV